MLFFSVGHRIYIHSHNHKSTKALLSPLSPAYYWGGDGTQEGRTYRYISKDIAGIFCNLIITERPVLNESQAVTVKFGLTLQQIMDVVSINNPNKIIIKG